MPISHRRGNLKIKINKRVATAMIVGMLGTIVVSGVAVATSHTSGDTYTGCLTNSGNLNNVAVGNDPTKPCQGNSTQISWNQTGQTEIKALQDQLDALKAVIVIDVDGEVTIRSDAGLTLVSDEDLTLETPAKVVIEGDANVIGETVLGGGATFEGDATFEADVDLPASAVVLEPFTFFKSTTLGSGQLSAECTDAPFGRPGSVLLSSRAVVHGDTELVSLIETDGVGATATFTDPTPLFGSTVVLHLVCLGLN